MGNLIPLVTTYSLVDLITSTIDFPISLLSYTTKQKEEIDHCDILYTNTTISTLIMSIAHKINASLFNYWP